MTAAISLNKQQWDDLVRLLGTVDARKVAKRATRDVAKTVRTRTARIMADDFTLKNGDIKKEMRVSQSGEMGAKVTLSGQRRSLRTFKGSPKVPRHEQSRTKGGKLRSVKYRYEIERGRKKVARNVFVQRTGRAGQEFVKTGDGTVGRRGRALPFRRRGRGRYPIDVVRGPSVPAIYQAKDKNRVAEDVVREARPLLAKRIRGQTFRLINQQMKTVNTQIEKVSS